MGLFMNFTYFGTKLQKQLSEFSILKPVSGKLYILCKFVCFTHYIMHFKMLFFNITLHILKFCRRDFIL